MPVLGQRHTRLKRASFTWWPWSLSTPKHASSEDDQTTSPTARLLPLTSATMMKKEKAEGLCPIIFQTDCNDTSTSFCPMTDHQWHTLMDNKDAQRTLCTVGQTPGPCTGNLRQGKTFFMYTDLVSSHATLFCEEPPRLLYAQVALIAWSPA